MFSSLVPLALSVWYKMYAKTSCDLHRRGETIKRAAIRGLSLICMKNTNYVTHLLPVDKGVTKPYPSLNFILFVYFFFHIDLVFFLHCLYHFFFTPHLVWSLRTMFCCAFCLSSYTVLGLFLRRARCIVGNAKVSQTHTDSSTFSEPSPSSLLPPPLLQGKSPAD